MSEDYNVRRAAALLGGLSAHGRTPDPGDEAHARSQLATARIDRELRNADRAGVQLNDAQARHLVGLLMSNCGVGGDAAARCEAEVRAVIATAQGAVQ